MINQGRIDRPSWGSGRVPARVAGFTLTELVIAIVLVGVLAAVAAVRWNAHDTTAPYQADLLARNVRHAQILAMTWGQRLRLTPTASAYSVSCVTPGAAPCDQSPVIDPATGAAFSVALQNAATLSGAALEFDSFGRPVSGGTPLSADQTLTVTAGSQSYTVTVRAVSGFVSVSTP